VARGADASGGGENMCCCHGAEEVERKGMKSR